jgi:bacillolysin
MAPVRRLGHTLVTIALASTALVAVDAAASAADPAGQALQRLDHDADGSLTVRRDGAGDVGFVGVPATTDVDNPAVGSSMSAAAAADAHLARYGAAFGTTRAGTTLTRTDVQQSVAGAGHVVRYQQRVDGVPVLGGQVVVSLAAGQELSSILAETSDVTSVPAATVGEDAARATAEAAFVKHYGSGDATTDSDGRWLLDAGLVGGDATGPDRTVWRIHVSRGGDLRRQVLVDDRTGGILMDVDEIEHVDRVVCDNAQVLRASDVPCTSGFARTEASGASGVADVNTAFDLSGVVSDFYQLVGGVDLTNLLGISVGGVKKLASTVRWCYSTQACPYANAFWNGSQMYYGTGYAGADDVVGHEMTHGFTERNSGLFYWGQSGAMNESISDIIGEIIDHRHASAGDSPTNWALGEDVPGYSPDGLRNMQDPTIFSDPDKTSSTLYRRETCTTGSCYGDEDGVHTNSGVGNKTFYLASQGGTFNGQTITGIDAGDDTLTKSAKLWLLVDQTLSSGSDYADEAVVLDQSCQALLGAGVAGFTAADCTNVHKATLATELSVTPTNNPQSGVDAPATCPAGTTKRVLLDSEAGAPTATFTAVGASWSRDGVPGWGQVAHTNPDAWASSDPATAGASSLVAAAGITVPAGQTTYLRFQQWRVLDFFTSTYYDGGAVEIDDLSTGTRNGSSGLPWDNGPSQTLATGAPIPAPRLAFGGDSRGYLASRVDVSSYAGHTIKPVFTLYSDASDSFVGWFVDDITLYTCDPVLLNLAGPAVGGAAVVGSTLTATPGSWTPTPDTFRYQWLRGGADIGGATSATYRPTAADVGAALSVRVTGAKAGYADVAAVSAPTSAVARGSLVRGRAAVAGKARVGSTLSARPGSWRPAPVSLRYQWLRNGKPIARATKSKYKLSARDKGKRVSVKVTGSKAGYQTASATSKATGKVKPKKR